MRAASSLAIANLCRQDQYVPCEVEKYLMFNHRFIHFGAIDKDIEITERYFFLHDSILKIHRETYNMFFHVARVKSAELTVLFENLLIPIYFPFYI